MLESPDSPDNKVPLALRQVIQNSPESIRTLAIRHGLNPKTVAKWRARTDMADRKRGPTSTVPRALSAADEALILAFRRYLTLSLDDSMAMLAARIPALSRSALHRLLKRHNLSRPPRRAIFDLPETASLPGCFHIDIVPIAIADSTHYLFFAIEQSSALIFGLLMADATQAASRDFLNALADGSPAPVRLVLTSNRFQFTTPGNTTSGVPDLREAMDKGTLARAHPFEYACAVAGIDHHLVPEHFPWDAERAGQIMATTREISTMAAPDAPMARQSLHVELGRHNECPLPSLHGVSPGAWLAIAGARTMNLRDVEPQEESSRRSLRGRDSTREAILEAAHIRLAKDGPEGLSLSEVARLAGINRGTAYQHFKTRDRLIAATGQWMSEKLHKAVFAGRSPSAEALGDQGMASIAGRLAHFAMDNPILCRAWLLQILSAPDPMQDYFWRDYKKAIASLASPEGQDDERVLDLEVASVGMLAGAFLWPTWASADAAADPSTVATRFALEWLRVTRPNP